MTPGLHAPDRCPPDQRADEVTAHTLLNCLVREVAGPSGQLSRLAGHAVVRLPHCDVTIRIRIRRRSLLGPDRFTGPVQALGPTGWAPVGWRRLVADIQRELELARGGEPNDELADQVRASRDLIAAVLRARPRPAPGGLPDDPAQDDPASDALVLDYLASEQSLLFGHRYHPTPKARSSGLPDVLPYAPEAGARFRLRFLAVHRSVLREEHVDPAAAAVFDRLGGPAAPDGYALLPVHPWQYTLLADRPALRSALAGGRLLDLGPGGPPVAPTASVRTVHHPLTGGFLKLSLNVRITNCVRKNADYELTGAVALTRLLAPVAADLAARFPGTVLLAEPAYRTADLGTELVEGLGVIVRAGLATEPGVTPLLAAALADEHGQTLGAVLRLAGRTGDPARHALAWWDRYVELLLPPVLYGYFGHGVAFEPHLQNVVVGVGPDGLPRQMFLRDLEGAKLLPGRHDAALAGLPERVREQVGYDAHRGWQRVAYCLLVNHLAEVLAALADRHPSIEAAGWVRVREHLLAYQRRFGDAPKLRALLAGSPLPAKANLLTRWARQADRQAGYLPLASPVGPRPLAGPVPWGLDRQVVDRYVAALPNGGLRPGKLSTMDGSELVR